MQNQTSNSDGYCLIGEADPFLGQLLQRFAEKSGFPSKIARNGETVLAHVIQEQPILILLDPELPGKVRGWEVVRQLVVCETNDAIPIILCAWLNEAEAQALVGQQLTHLQKPDLHFHDFLSALAIIGVKPGS